MQWDRRGAGIDLQRRKPPPAGPAPSLTRMRDDGAEAAVWPNEERA